MNTHIWETPLPEPQEGEYTLPASMKRQQGMTFQSGQQQPDSDGAEIGTTSHHFHPEMPLNVHQSQNPGETNMQVQYTMPVKLKSDQHQVDPTMTHDEYEYTIPVKMKEQTNPVPASTTSDYTIPVLPQPVPDTPDSESE